MLHVAINNKLKFAKKNYLISDILSNIQMLAFLGFIAVITNEFFEKEPLVVEMVSIPYRHCAEDRKSAIEIIINSFNFDFYKIQGKIFLFFEISGINPDEGSAFVSLLKQLLNLGKNEMACSLSN
jgi:hypothetical protein